MDNKSRYSFMLCLYRWAKKLSSLGRPLVQIENNFNFKKRVIKLARSPCYIVQSCERDLNIFLYFYRAKQDNGCEVNEASNLHAANVLNWSSFFFLTCSCTVSVRSPYSLKSRGEISRVCRVNLIPVELLSPSQNSISLIYIPPCTGHIRSRLPWRAKVQVLSSEPHERKLPAVLSPTL